MRFFVLCFMFFFFLVGGTSSPAVRTHSYDCPRGRGARLKAGEVRHEVFATPFSREKEQSKVSVTGQRQEAPTACSHPWNCDVAALFPLSFSALDRARIWRGGKGQQNTRLPHKTVLVTLSPLRVL